MRIVVAGASGYIGSRLLEVARTAGEAEGTACRARDGLKTLDLQSVTPEELGWLRQDDVVCLTAALSAPDVCAREPQRARAVNVEGALRLARAALSKGARVIFFSSDTVYGGREESFDETAPLAPAGDYAAMKAEVEAQMAGEVGFRSVRLSYVFSAEDKFTRYLGHCAARGDAAEIFDPFVRAVVHREDVVEGVLALAHRWHEIDVPAINFGGPAAISRGAFAEALRSVQWPALRFQVTTPPDDFFLNRPRTIAMRSPLLERLLGRPPRGILEAARLEFHNPS